MKHTILMPDLGQTTAEGKLLRWMKLPGDRILKGEPLIEVETDKVTMKVEAYLDGTIRELLAAEGNMVSAMSPIAIVTDSPDEDYEKAHPAPTVSPLLQPSARPQPIAKSASDSERISAAPSARTLARELGIELANVKGSGPGGLITRNDVVSYSERSIVVATKPMAAMAALTSKSMQTIPHFYMTADLDVSHAEQWRIRWNAANPDLKASANDVLVRVASIALGEVPALNVAFDNAKYVQGQAADVLLIVTTERGTLALVPLRDPGIPQWDECLRSLHATVADAKQGHLEESSLSRLPLLAISNLGMHGAKEFTAIIPPGCTAVLAIGTIRDAALVINAQIGVGRICTITLSADHRVVDGVTAVKFLQKIQEHLNTL